MIRENICHLSLTKVYKFKEMKVSTKEKHLFMIIKKTFLLIIIKVYKIKGMIVKLCKPIQNKTHYLMKILKRTSRYLA